MPYYAYKARNARGDMLQGVLESADSGSVADQLFNTGVTPVEITLTKIPAAEGESGWRNRLTEDKIRPIDVQLFSRQMYTLLKAGVPIIRGLPGLQDSAINKSFSWVLIDVREGLY